MVSKCHLGRLFSFALSVSLTNVKTLSDGNWEVEKKTFFGKKKEGDFRNVTLVRYHLFRGRCRRSRFMLGCPSLGSQMGSLFILLLFCSVIAVRPKEGVYEF